MIANMVNLAQLFLHFVYSSPPWHPAVGQALCLGLVGGLLVGCGPPEPGPSRRATPVSPSTGLDGPVSEPSSPDPVDVFHTPPDPLAAWTFADTPDDFHQTWMARFALLASAEPEESTLLPYADAIMRYGASWGIEPADIEQILLDSTGQPYRRTGSDHPPTLADNDSRPPDPAWLNALGWNTLLGGGGLQLTDQGSGIRLVGPLIAQPSCMGCHSYDDGEVVGAFVYRFSEIADD